MKRNGLTAGRLRANLQLRNRARAVALLILLGVSGCRIPALCCPEPGPDLPGEFNGTVDVENSAEVTIDEFFDEPMLSQLIAQGLNQNQHLKIVNQEIQIASNEILSRRGAYLPFVSIGTSGGLDRTSRYTPLGAAEDQLFYPGGGRFPDPLTNTRLSANLVWQIDIWRQLRNARDAAIQRYYESIDQRDYLITQLVAETASSYYELAALDKRIVYLNQTIELQQRSLEVATLQKEAARGTELGVQRFLAEVRKNESQRLIVQQQIIEVENRINFLVGRYPERVDRAEWDLIQLDSRALHAGMPSQLLQNRRDVRAAEREIAASGLDIAVARANFYPKLVLTAGVGYEAFNPRYLFDPGTFIASAAGELVAPLINKKAIQAEYMNANARQLQAIYEYQRTLLNAYTEVINSLSKVENYRQSVAIKKEQVTALEQSVDVATNLFQGARKEVEYMDVLFAQRDLLDARTDLIETKQQHLAAIVDAYRALGGGLMQSGMPYGAEEILWISPEAEPAPLPASPTLPPAP